MVKGGAEDKADDRAQEPAADAGVAQRRDGEVARRGREPARDVDRQHLDVRDEPQIVYKMYLRARVDAGVGHRLELVGLRDP
jgi:hypothetical protein